MNKDYAMNKLELGEVLVMYLRSDIRAHIVGGGEIITLMLQVKKDGEWLFPPLPLYKFEGEGKFDKLFMEIEKLLRVFSI